jgi:RNA polymerase sigma-70 factor (ECF subfamily)
VALSEAQFRALFEAERDRTYRFLHRLCGQRADAEDLLQETFLTVWRKRDQFEGRGSGGGYVRRTAYHLYLNDRAKWRRRRELAPAHLKEGAPERTAAPAAQVAARKDAIDYLLARMHDAVDQLPDGAREAFILFRCEGLSCAEIAALSGETPSAIESRIRRATRTVAKSLAPHRAELPLS